MQELIRERGGAVIETGADGIWDVSAESKSWGKPRKEMGFKALHEKKKKAQRVAARFFRRTAAAVTTNSTYIYAIAPEFLMRMLDEGKFYEIGQQTHGVIDAGAPYTYEFGDGIELMNQEILNNYGAVFKLNQDGYINLTVPDGITVREEEAPPQYTTPKKQAGSGGTMHTPKTPPINNINPAEGNKFSEALKEFRQIWLGQGGVTDIKGEKIDGVNAMVVETDGGGTPIMPHEYDGFPVVVKGTASRVAARYLRGRE